MKDMDYRTRAALAKRVITQTPSQVTQMLPSGNMVMLDPIDVDLGHLPWTDEARGYVFRRNGEKLQRLYRIIGERIAGRPLLATEEVDHINHNKRDNRRINLRIVTHQQNQRNLPIRRGHKFKGVGRCRGKFWRAYITLDGRQTFIGEFLDEIDAAYAYDQFALALFGENACFNVIDK